MQNHAKEFGDDLVLVTGYSRTDLKQVLRSKLHTAMRSNAGRCV